MGEPLQDWVELEVAPRPSMTAGGIALPDRALQPKSTREVRAATVRSVGPGAWKGGVLVAPTVGVGDRVLVLEHYERAELDERRWLVPFDALVWVWPVDAAAKAALAELRDAPSRSVTQP